MVETHLILKKYFDRKKRTQPGFSLRLLAKRLERSPSFLSRIFSGEKPIPHALLLKLENLLDIDREVFMGLKKAHQIEEAIPKRGKSKFKTELQDWEMADKDSHRLLRQWFYLPIMDLTHLKNFDGTTESIAKRLRISKTAAEIAVRDLESLGLLVRKDGKLKKSTRKLRWASSKSLEDIRIFHKSMLKKAEEELNTATSTEDFQKRLITGITLTASSEKIEEAKRKLSECLHEIANDLTQDSGDEVYHLAAQLFPLTK